MTQLNIRIYYEDTDAGGIVYHANHLKYMERGRTEWLRELGLEQDQLMAQNIAFVASEVAIKYVHPARFNQLITVTTEVAKMRRVGMLFKQEIHDQDGQLIASADVTIAAVDPTSMKLIPIPLPIKEVIERAL
ncbi:tol-pal system-associated acyl-CoA thioesterase [Celerinatantimonas sp. YJH-8]|uniref:tol-pal system-associated acyl-CoA thioesterase n=1 Tax=Celerinatantimonas sp. YJH-8 TaxID=3228714 RepID=UPI0038BFA8A8